MQVLSVSHEWNHQIWENKHRLRKRMLQAGCKVPLTKISTFSRDICVSTGQCMLCQYSILLVTPPPRSFFYILLAMTAQNLMNLIISHVSFLLWNLSDPKGKFSCYAFIINNKVLLYLNSVGPVFHKLSCCVVLQKLHSLLVVNHSVNCISWTLIQSAFAFCLAYRLATVWCHCTY